MKHISILNDILVCISLTVSAIFHDILAVLNSDLSSEGLFGGVVASCLLVVWVKYVFPRGGLQFS